MIRYLTLRDQSTYAAIRLEALASDPDAFGETLETARKRSEADWTSWLSKVIIPDQKNIIVIELEGKPVAMCGFGLSDEDHSTGFIWGMFVSPSHRRRNYGRILLEEAEKWIRGKGGKQIKSCVAAPNQEAIDFYRGYGFAIGQDSGFLRPGSDISTYPIEKTIGASQPNRAVNSPKAGG
jgi:ribosomal protein S18 acetylase RimI-like enzyme